MKRKARIEDNTENCCNEEQPVNYQNSQQSLKTKWE